MLIVTLFGPEPGVAQIGGNNTYEFLNLPVAARVTAVGGNLITVRDDDPTLAYQNPALLNPEMHDRISFNTALYFGGVKYGYAGYAWKPDSLPATLGAGIQYTSYGKMQGALANGEKTVDFTAGEYALNFGGAIQRGPYSYGGNIKAVHSFLDTYTSFGVLADAGIHYLDTARRLTASLVLKNIGRQIKSYTPNHREPMPFEIQAGISQRLKHLPLRLSVILHNLQRFDIRYSDPDEVVEVNPLSTDSVQKEKKFIVDKIFRHFIFGGELFIGKNITVMLGYNHLRRMELTTETKKGISGFSGGLRIKVKGFDITYGRAHYFVAGATNHFSMTTHLSRFTRKKREVKVKDEG